MMPILQLRWFFSHNSLFGVSKRGDIREYNLTYYCYHQGWNYMKKNKKMVGFLMVCVAVGTIFPAATSMVPQWDIGDWWVVESQYWDDPSGIVLGVKPHWTKIFSWKYVVETTDTISNEKYYVVSMKQIQDTGFKYQSAFKYWLRISDLFVGRFEIENFPTDHSPETDPARLVRRDYSPKDLQSFNTFYQPMVPLSIPLFRSGMDTIIPKRDLTYNDEERKHYKRHDCEYIQESKSIEINEALNVAHSKFKNRLPKRTQKDSKLVVFSDMESNDNINRSEKQYWISGIPWAVYGESIENNTLTKKYWLVEIGKGTK
jgi:hypothetical protein